MTQSTLRRTGARSILALTLALFPTALAARAQATNAGPSDCSQISGAKDRSDCARAHAETKTIRLKNVTNQNDANEIMVAVRNTFDPEMKIYLAAAQNAIVITTYPEQMARVEALIQSLDHPRKIYRLLFTITDVDGDKTISTQHVSMVAVAGERTTIKEGDKIPLATGSSSTGNIATQTQFTYIDVGMNFDATIEEQANGVSLTSKIEQSSVGPSNTIAGVQEPVIRQTVLQGTSLLTPDKPIMLGSIDVPTTTHHFDIAVVLQAIK